MCKLLQKFSEGLKIIKSFFKVLETGIGEKNINDCPALTIKFNAACGQSVMFFLQVNTAFIHFKVVETCGGGDSILNPMI
jgi:hypothetical protein